MRKLILTLVAALTIFIGLLVGRDVTNKKIDAAIELETCPMEEFYPKAVNMKRGSSIRLYEFPKSLRRMRSARPGDCIFESGKDSVIFICSFPNQADTINRYPYYVFKDNHNNLWSFFQYKEHFYKLCREDEKEHENWLSFNPGNINQD